MISKIARLWALGFVGSVAWWRRAVACACAAAWAVYVCRHACSACRVALVACAPRACVCLGVGWFE